VPSKEGKTVAVYFIDSHGSDTALLVKGLAKTMTLAKATVYRQAAVWSHNRHKLATSNIWEEAIGRDIRKNLAKGEVNIDGCNLFLLTPRIDPSGFIQGPILAYASSSRFLLRILYHPRATDVVYVPWTKGERDQFKCEHPNAISF
jgi:hypothetical protein